MKRNKTKQTRRHRKMNNKLTINNKPISVVRSGAKMLMPISDIAKFHIMII